MGRLARDDRPFYNIDKFAHIAGPIIVHQKKDCFGGDACYGAVIPLPELVKIVFSKDGNIMPSLSKRGNMNRINTEPIKQVLPKAAGRHLFP